MKTIYIVEKIYDSLSQDDICYDFDTAWENLDDAKARCDEFMKPGKRALAVSVSDENPLQGYETGYYRIKIKYVYSSKLDYLQGQQVIRRKNALTKLTKDERELLGIKE